MEETKRERTVRMILWEARRCAEAADRLIQRLESEGFEWRNDCSAYPNHVNLYDDTGPIATIIVSGKRGDLYHLQSLKKVVVQGTNDVEKAMAALYQIQGREG